MVTKLIFRPGYLVTGVIAIGLIGCGKSSSGGSVDTSGPIAGKPIAPMKKRKPGVYTVIPPPPPIAFTLAELKTAKPVADSGLLGIYKQEVDEDKIAAAIKDRPTYAEDIARARKQAPRFKINQGGTLAAFVKGIIAHGVVTRIRGHLAIVVMNPKPKPGEAPGIALTVAVIRNGAGFMANAPNVDNPPKYVRIR